MNDAFHVKSTLKGTLPMTKRTMIVCFVTLAVCQVTLFVSAYNLGRDAGYLEGVQMFAGKLR